MGLGTEAIRTPLSASYAFEEWLASEQFLAVVEHYREEGAEPTCLLDIITLWVVNTDAALHYPNFQTFLLSVLEIVNQWQRDTQVFRSAFLWPLPEGQSEDGLIIGTLAGDHEGSAIGRAVVSHPVMHEANFLLHQAALRTGGGSHQSVTP